MQEKHIIIVAHAFYPATHVGAHRVTKLVKYWAKDGKSVHVVCPVQEPNTEMDSFYTERATYCRLTPWSRLIPKTWVFAIKAWLEVAKQIKWSRKNNLDPLVLLTGPNFTHFIVGPFARLKGVKYVLDYRDNWSIMRNTHRDQVTLKSIIKKMINRPLERLCLYFADHVVFVTPQLVENYQNHFGIQHAVCIENGFDEDDFENIEPTQFNKRTVVLAGLCYYYSAKLTERLVGAAVELAKSRKDFQLEVYNNEQGFRDVVKHYNAEDVVHVHDPIAYEEVLKKIAGSEVGLCVLIYPKSQFGTKLFDYIALKKKVLVVNDDWPALDVTDIPKYLPLYYFKSDDASINAKTLSEVLDANVTFDTASEVRSFYTRKAIADRYQNLLEL